MYVISHERSGTHLCLNTILKNAAEPLVLRNVGEWLPGYGHLNRFEHIDEAVADLPPNALVKSHCDADLFRGVYPKAPVVYVLRHPCATLWSFYHYLKHPEYLSNNRVLLFRGDGHYTNDPGTFSEFLRKPLAPFLKYSYSLRGDFDNVVERWAKHVQGWLEQADVVVTFEGLVGDPACEMGLVQHATGMAMNDTVRSVTFGEMPSVLPRKGQIDEWREHVSADDERFILDTLGLSLRRALPSHLRL